MLDFGRDMIYESRSEPLLPRPEFGEVYDALYRRHRELYAALRPLFS